MELANVNWLAVGVGAVVAFFAGWLVYSPILFIKGWAEGSGVDLDGNGPGGKAIGIQFLGLIVLSLVVGITATSDALLTAILAIIACAIFAVSNGAFVGKSGFAMAVDGGYILLAGIIMILAQGIF